MTDPYVDLKVQVSLTELKDVSFPSGYDSFACGYAFVLGQGKYIDERVSG
jgi:hypothetical protein